MKMLRLSIFILLSVLIIGCYYWFSKKEVITKDDTNINTQEDDKINHNDIIARLSPDEAKKIINDSSKRVVLAVSNMDMDKLSRYIHPVNGVRFSCYGIVDKETDLVFSSEEIKKLFRSNKIYQWGYYAGSGDPIELTARDFFKKFIYHSDFLRADKIGYNKILTDSGYPENQFIVYPDAIIIEYYFSGNEKMAWRSLRIVFEQYQNNWYVSGIIFNEWTP